MLALGKNSLGLGKIHVSISNCILLIKAPSLIEAPPSRKILIS